MTGLQDGNGEGQSVVGLTSPRSVVIAQSQLLEHWIMSPAAHVVATQILRKRSLSYAPNELIHEGWIRLQRSMASRTEPLPEMSDLTSAARYCLRVLDNLSRDWVRTSLRRQEISVSSEQLTTTADHQTLHSDRMDPTDPHRIVETRLLLEQLVHKVAERAERGIDCVACPPEVVVATALEILQMALAGIQPGDQGRDWIDQLMYSALDRVASEPAASTAARTQRKSRCGRCVMELLNAGMLDLGGGDSQ